MNTTTAITTITTLATADTVDALFDVITGVHGAADRHPITAEAWQTLAVAAGYATDDEDADVDMAAHAAAVAALVAVGVCPVHMVDVDICADDDDPSCAGHR